MVGPMPAGPRYSLDTSDIAALARPDGVMQGFLQVVRLFHAHLVSSCRNTP